MTSKSFKSMFTRSLVMKMIIFGPPWNGVVTLMVKNTSLFISAREPPAIFWPRSENFCFAWELLIVSIFECFKVYAVTCDQFFFQILIFYDAKSELQNSPKKRGFIETVKQPSSRFTSSRIGMLFRSAIENRHRHNKDRYHRAINTDFMALLPNSSSSRQPVVRIRSRGGKIHNTTTRVDKVKLLARNSPWSATGEFNASETLFNIRREPDVKHAPEMRFRWWARVSVFRGILHARIKIAIRQSGSDFVSFGMAF